MKIPPKKPAPLNPNGFPVFHCAAIDAGIGRNEFDQITLADLGYDIAESPGRMRYRRRYQGALDAPDWRDAVSPVSRADRWLERSSEQRGCLGLSRREHRTAIWRAHQRQLRGLRKWHADDQLNHRQSADAVGAGGGTCDGHGGRLGLVPQVSPNRLILG